MLIVRLLVAMSLGSFLLGSYAEAGCPKGHQPWKTSRVEVCLPDSMVAYLACLESSGGGRITVEQTDATSSSKKVSVGLEGGGGNLVAKGKGKIAVDTANGGAAINQIKQQFDPKNNTNCYNAAFRVPAAAPQKPPKQAASNQSLQQGSSDSQPPPIVPSSNLTPSTKTDGQRTSQTKIDNAKVNLMASNWERLWPGHGAVAELKPFNKSLRVSIRKTGVVFSDVQLFSYGHALDPNQTYQVELDAQSNKACDIRAKFHRFVDTSEDVNAQEPEYCKFPLAPGINSLQQVFTSLDIKKNIRFTIYFGECDPDTEITITKLELTKTSAR